MLTLRGSNSSGTEGHNKHSLLRDKVSVNSAHRCGRSGVVRCPCRAYIERAQPGTRRSSCTGVNRRPRPARLGSHVLLSFLIVIGHPIPVSTAVPAADPIQVLQAETEMGDTTQLRLFYYGCFIQDRCTRQPLTSGMRINCAKRGAGSSASQLHATRVSGAPVRGSNGLLGSGGDGGRAGGAAEECE